MTNERTTTSQSISLADHRRYRILGVLGLGGFGTVYHARMEGSDGFVKEVAIKLLSDPDPAAETLSRFRDEARILGLLRDRAIPSVDPPTRLQGRWAVVMEFVDGVDCRRALREFGRLPPTVALGIVEEVARTLHNLWNHPGEDGKAMRLLHRDIKPSNLQITPNGDVKVLDFGVARAEFDTRESTTSANIAGTRGYIAPERLEGVEDHRGDVYSLGVVLEELVTGLRPSLLDVPRPDVESGLSQSPLPGFAGVPPDVLVLARSMREPQVDNRPTADQVERRCAELVRQLEGPTLREWARDRVSRTKEGREPDGLVGQTLSHTLPRISYDSPPSAAPDRGWTVLTLMLGATAATVALLVVLLGIGSVGVLWFYAKRPVAEVVPEEPAIVEPDAPEPNLSEEDLEVPEAPEIPDAPEEEVAKNAPPEPPKPTRRKTPKPKPTAAPTGTISQSGADSIELVGEAGRFRPGKVPAGRYSVYALFSGQTDAVPAGTVELGAGGRVELRCDARFKRCISQ